MLAKSHKLNTADFKNVFENGQTKHSDYFTVKYLTSQTETKVAVVVSKKNYKTAVERNYKRRVIYNICKQLPNYLLIKISAS